MIYRILLLVFFALASSCTWSREALLVSKETKRVDVAQYMSVLRDSGGKMTISEVENASGWSDLPGSFNQGFTKDAVWLRFDIKHAENTPHDWILEINNAVLDDLRLFRRISEGNCEEHIAGEDIPREQWDIPYRNPVFRIYLTGSGQETFWLRITSRNSISAQITLWQPVQFGQATRNESLGYGFLLGAYLAIIVIHLFFWRMTKESVSGWYALYVIDSFFHVALSFGYVQQYTGMPGHVSDHLLALLVCMSIWIGARMSSGVLELEPRMPRTHQWLIRLTALIAAITASLSVTVGYSYGMAPAQISGFIESLALIVIAVLLLRQGHKPAAFFLAAFGCLCVGVMLRVARNFMMLPPNFVTENSFQIGAIAHMLLMNLAIIKRYNSMKASAEKAQEEALKLKTLHAKILEEEVSARTISLTSEIHRRQQLEAELRNSLEVEKRARQEQRDFVAMASHEFRTPLAIIDTSAQRISGSNPEQATLERCDNIREATRRMTKLMDEFLSLDRLDSDLRLFAPKEEKLMDVIVGAIAEWERGSVQVSYSNIPKTLHCDPSLLRIALRNLLANAIRHSPDGVPVMFHISGQADGLLDFEIVDTGSGIPPDEIPKLFQKYFRGRAAQGKPGAGLGLYLVQQIAKLHAGTVTVTSDATGSRFILSLPSINARMPSYRSDQITLS